MSSKTRKVRVDIKLLGHLKLSCPRCEKLSDFDASQIQDSACDQHIACDCGYTFSALIEDRSCTRKTVSLFGVYLLSDLIGRQETGPVRIENLSYSGILCRTVASHTLTPGDSVSIKFVLDDEAKTELVRTLEVTRVEGELIAGKFIEAESAFDTNLADYLITR
jgi:hypothetical protein